MICFSHKLFFDKDYESIFTKKNVFLIEVKEPISLKGCPHVLVLKNNQDRIVNIYSNDNYKNIKDKQLLIFSIDGVADFFWNVNSLKVSYYRYKNISNELINYWYLHTVLPLYFTFDHRLYFLHSGAVEIDDNVILFIADSYGGKSTLTDFFIKKNHTMLSDDKVGFEIDDESFMAVPSYPYHRPYRKAEDLGIKVSNFSKSKKKVKVIYHLNPSDAKSDILISEVYGLEKFKILRNCTDIDLKEVLVEERFEFLAKLSNNQRVFNITIPWDLNRLEEVYQTIITYTRGL